jgi:hypothetical protein
MAKRPQRVYNISMSERNGEPDAKFFYEITAADAVLAIRRARKRAAQDFCLDLRDIVVDDAALDEGVLR